MQFVGKIILFVGLPAGVLVSMDIGGLLDIPQWLFAVAYTTVALVLLTSVVAVIFGRVD